MLEDLRSASKTSYAKIVIFGILLIFIIGGIYSGLGGGSSHLAKISSIGNITISEFKSAMNMYPITEGVDRQAYKKAILNQVIYKKILDAIAAKYHIEISDEFIASRVKEEFKNKEGEFDYQIFLNVLNKAKITESEYFQHTKDAAKRKIIIQSFSGAYVPSKLIEYWSNYYYVNRTVEYVKLYLPQTNSNVKSPNKGELLKFYQNNTNLFAQDETRDVKYIAVPNKYIEAKIKLSSKEIEEYSKNFNLNKQAAEKALKKEKFVHRYSQMIDSIEDEIAAGSSLEELSKNFNIHIYSKQKLKKEDKVEDLKDYMDEVFTLQEAEISRVLEQKNGFLLFQVNKIQYPHIADFNQNEVRKQWYLYHNRQENIAILNNIIKSGGKNFKKNAEKSKLNVSKIEVSKNSDINPLLKNEILNLNLHQISSEVIEVGNWGYVAYISNVYLPNKAISSSEKIKLKQAIQDNVFEELMRTLFKKYKIEVNNKLLENI